MIDKILKELNIDLEKTKMEDVDAMLISLSVLNHFNVVDKKDFKKIHTKIVDYIYEHRR